MEKIEEGASKQPHNKQMRVTPCKQDKGSRSFKE